MMRSGKGQFDRYGDHQQKVARGIIIHAQGVYLIPEIG